MRPLDGITVIALEHAVAAPLAARQLTDRARGQDQQPKVGDFARDFTITQSGHILSFRMAEPLRKPCARSQAPRAAPIFERLLVVRTW
jgi:crotonobetainyl-CoA:carnitine CoA-transferase CaiB-like acyl-CoA transferase